MGQNTINRVHFVSASIGLLAILAAAILALAPSLSAREDAQNASIVRLFKGKMEYRKISDQSPQGSEEFSLTVHPDGSRTLNARNDYDGSGVQRHVIHRVAANFRPLETLAVYWRKGVWSGTGLFVTNGDTLEATVQTEDGLLRQTLKVPEHFSMVPHPISSNAWHGWYYDKQKGGKQTYHSFDIIAASSENAMMLGKMRVSDLEYLGRKSMTTKAGTYDVDHFRTGSVDYYTTGEDQIMVKFEWKQFNVEYVLTELTQVR